MIPPVKQDDPLTRRVIGLAIQVHRALGPGLLEQAYESCLEYELLENGIAIARQVPIAIKYKLLTVRNAYRIDLLVEGTLLLELKAIERVLAIHEVTTLTYMRLADIKVGLLINFHVPVLRSGIKRFVR